MDVIRPKSTKKIERGFGAPLYDFPAYKLYRQDKMRLYDLGFTVQDWVNAIERHAKEQESFVVFQMHKNFEGYGDLINQLRGLPFNEIAILNCIKVLLQKTEMDFDKVASIFVENGCQILNTVKEVKRITGLGLKETKDLVDGFLEKY